MCQVTSEVRMVLAGFNDGVVIMSVKSQFFVCFFSLFFWRGGGGGGELFLFLTFFFLVYVTK